MSDATTPVSDPAAGIPEEELASSIVDIDPAETQEWLESLEYVLKTRGAERVKYLLDRLDKKARRSSGAEQYALHQHDPQGHAAALSGQPRN